jgi:ABC-2 type transport system ATP-binding protein
MNHPIETSGLVKRYGEITAVDHLSLQVDKGEIYAFLGLNGAGKTTTIRMLLGMIKPTSGTATVLGCRVRQGSRQPWASVGYLVETPRAYPELTVYENLEVARRLHPGTKPQAISQVIERLALTPYADRRAGVLSQGNAQRLGLAKALLHSPELLILDEPANGLDPAGIVDIRELLLELTCEQGITVLMSSHILGEVSRIAQRIGIIHRGRLLQELDADELKCNRRKRLLVRARDGEAARNALSAAGYSVAATQSGSLELRDAAAIECPDEVASLLVCAGTPPTQLIVKEEDLEQYFLRLIGEDGLRVNERRVNEAGVNEEGRNE